ncbi:fasciclin domain-containing protein [Erythrobacter sp.]|jgi:uncharacterized surface protein with fasciclin (FAS1) repeats|uniref:fasciclin domain-containing protein n=1 Tax=Erythrobacter sp. TaxID=1042 RepID=UPI002E9EF1B9|nr:fasciclin domain-containing protein [Erythrobacter sp.]
MNNRTGVTGLLTALALTLAACDEEAGDIAASETPVMKEAETLAEAIAGENSLSKARDAFERTGLAGILEGPASYTVLVPTDEAFGALGSAGNDVFENEENGAIAAAVLRSHIIPGALDPDSIGQALPDADGEATMTNFAGEVLVLSRKDDRLVVATDGGREATLAGTAIRAGNGVVIPIDTVLVDPSQLPGS